MNWFAVPPLVSGILLLLIGLIVFMDNKKSKINRIFALATLAAVWWLFFFSLMYLSDNETSALMLARIGFIGVIFIPLFEYHFIRAVLGKKEDFLLKAGYALTFIMMFFSGNDVFYSGVNKYFWGYYPVAGKFYFISWLTFGLYFIFGLLLLFRSKNDVSLPAKKRQQINYLFLGFMICTFASVDYLAKYPRFAVYPFGYICVLIFCITIAYAIVKYQLMEVKIVITRATIFLFIYTFALGIPVWMSFKLREQLVPIFAMFLLATISPVIYQFLQKKADAILQSRQRKYQKFVQSSSRNLMQEHDMDKLTKYVVRLMKWVVRPEFVAFYIKDKTSFVNTACGGKEKIVLEDVLCEEHKLIVFIKDYSSVITKDQIRAGGFSGCCEIILPLTLNNDLLGFLLIGPRKDKLDYMQEDIETFEIVRRQISFALKHCVFLDVFKKTQEKIVESDKLTSIGGMASGIVHQMKNRLNLFSFGIEALKYDIQNLAETNQDIIEQKPSVKESINGIMVTLKTVMDNSKNTSNLINGLVNYVRTQASPSDFSEFSLKDLIDIVIVPIETKHSLNDLPIEIQLPANDTIYGVKGQLVEVFFNLIDNAFEATEERMNCIKSIDDKSKYDQKIVIRLFQEPGSSVIEIEDNGAGIAEDFKKDMFTPFATTKNQGGSGFGIGAYLAKRIVEEIHKGKLYFESEYMKGTRFTIELPKIKPD